MTTASLLPQPRAVFYDANGDPLAGGFVYTYVPGGSTPKLTWQDATEATPNENPIVLDADGSCLLYGDGNYQLTATDALGNSIPAYSGLTTDVLGGLSGQVFQTVANIAALRAGTVATLINGYAYVLGYYTTADGGEGPFAVGVAGSDNGGTIINDASGRSWHREGENRPLTVKMFGAKGDGSTDDTTSINLALAVGGNILFGKTDNYYRVSGPLNITVPGSYAGAGQASTIKTTSLTADVFVLSNVGITLENLFISATVNKTAGIHISIIEGASQCTMRRLVLDNIYRGIFISSTTAQQSSVHGYDLIIQNYTNPNGTQIGIVIDGGVEVSFSNVDINANGGDLASGIFIARCGDVVLRGISTVKAGDGMHIAPTTGQVVQLVMVSDCLFDTGSGAGIAITPTGAGNVQAVKISDTWCATNASNGIAIQPASIASVQQVDILNCVVSNNMVGISIVGASAVHTRVQACSVSANLSHGVLIGSGVQNFQILGNWIGQSGEFAGNGGFGIAFSGAGQDGYSILDNQLSGGNGSGAMAAVAGSIEGQTYWIARNQGFVTDAKGTITTTAGPTSFTIAHGLAMTPSIADITLTPATSLGLAASFWVSALDASNLTITFNTAPGSGVSIVWSARITGT